MSAVNKLSHIVFAAVLGASMSAFADNNQKDIQTDSNSNFITNTGNNIMGATSFPAEPDRVIQESPPNCWEEWGGLKTSCLTTRIVERSEPVFLKRENAAPGKPSISLDRVKRIYTDAVMCTTTGLGSECRTVSLPIEAVPERKLDLK